MIEVTFILKNGVVFKVVCNKFSMKKNGFQESVGYTWEPGPSDMQQLRFVAPEDISAITTKEIP